LLQEDIGQKILEERRFREVGDCGRKEKDCRGKGVSKIWNGSGRENVEIIYPKGSGLVWENVSSRLGGIRRGGKGADNRAVKVKAQC